MNGFKSAAVTPDQQEGVLQAPPRSHHEEVVDLLVHLAQMGVSVREESGNLRLDGNIAALTEDCIGTVRGQKHRLVELLTECDEQLQLQAGVAEIGQEAELQHRHRIRWQGGGRGLNACVLDLDGCIEVKRLREAVERLRTRHDVLQCSGTAGAFREVVLAGTLDQAALDTLCDEHFRQTSDAFQIWYLHHALGYALVLLARPHIADEASLVTLSESLAVAYRAGAADDEEAEQGSSRLRFSDFALAEKRYLAHPLNLQKWKRAQDALGAHPITTIAPVVMGGQLERRAAQLDAVATADLWLLAAEQGVAPFAVLAHAFALAYGMEALTDRLLFLVPFPNRVLAELRRVVGPFESEVGVWGCNDSRSSIAASLRRIHTAIAEGYSAQVFPLEDGSLAGSGGIRFALATQATSAAVFDGRVANFSTLRATTHDAIMSLHHVHGVDGIRLELSFDPGCVSHEAVDRILCRYMLLARSLRYITACCADDLPVDPVRLTEFLSKRQSSPETVLLKVRQVFAAVLGLPSVASDGNFFELAGNSLSIAKVVSRLKREFGVAISFSEVFRHPTPAGLSEIVLSRTPAQHPELTALDPLRELPASPQQVRYFASYNVTVAPSARMTVLHGQWDDGPAFEQAVSHVVARHELLRTSFFECDGQLMLRVHPCIHPQIDRVPLIDTDEASQQAALEALVRSSPIDLCTAPLAHVLIAERGDGGVRSVLAVFNGILDAYSEGLLEKELEEAYRLACIDALSTRPPLKLQYQDFCRWQHKLAQSEVHSVSQAHWESLYPEDYPGFHYPVPAGEGARRGQMRAFLLGEDLSSLARDAASACECSLFGYLLANFFELAAHIYQRGDVSVGLLYHGRENEEMQELIGYFVDMFCLREDVRVGEGFTAMVKRVNDQLFRSVDMRTYQYQELAARYGASPADTVFPVTGFHVNNVIVPGKERQVPSSFESKTFPLPYSPKFDFNIYVHESNRGILLRMAYAVAVADENRAEEISDLFIRIVEANTAMILENSP